VQRAADEYKPLVIASIAYDIAKAFASFYDKCPVIQAEENVKIPPATGDGGKAGDG